MATSPMIVELETERESDGIMEAFHSFKTEWSR